MEENIIDLSNCESVEYFTRTMQLRYMQRHMVIGNDIEYIPMLQQMWQGSNGTQKWEWVEIEVG